MHLLHIITNPRWRTDAILKIVFAISGRHTGRSTRNLEHRSRITCRYMTRDQNCTFRKFKMADGRHIENSFLAIFRRHINRLMRDLDRKYRITCQYRMSDQNCDFRKFKMADGRHFKNSFISMSQP